ncbi:hypothetical protein [Mycobacteroides chelonae]|uniref:hypothetical protein n=1 Tax=Mycobacteroides chelonae TaxID=1774 RepID=UPI00099404CB|nr:hypothetical protein [Mycobacteroides chelonae]
MKNDHWWWRVPEFVAEQEKPDWKAWVEALQLGMELYAATPEHWFPGIPEDDWFSDEAISFVERTMLERYEDRQALDANRDDKLHFVKYFGEAFVQKLECRWVWQPKVDKYWVIDGPAIEFPWPTDMLFDVIPMINATIRRRTGEEWLFVFRNNREDYNAWKAQGSPKSWDWP